MGSCGVECVPLGSGNRESHQQPERLGIWPEWTRAEADGLARTRSWVLEALLAAHTEGELDASVPAGSTFGTAECGGCRIYHNQRVCE
ncbi:hypothetical protein GCM10009680_50640 [Streptomyces yatensis]|uniref:Uncharacterized protein n=1 Tax=Streptomyces yatensis TaxID=155177 RepID=A0ABN2IEH3_9ACTN